MLRNVRARIDAAEALPTYVYEWSDVNGLPHILSMRPVFRGGENANDQQTRMFIAASIQSMILARVRQAGLRGNRTQLLARVSGSLIAYSTDEGPQRTASLGRSITLAEMLPEVIEELMETITQSQTTTQIYQIEWRFVINPRIFVEGGSDKIKVPKNLKTVDQSWTSFSDEKGSISCAATAIVLAMNGSTSQYIQYPRNPARLVKDARKFQDDMGWGEFVNSVEIAQVVKKYPKYRLSILQNEKSSKYYTFTGAEFEPTSKGIFILTRFKRFF